jgi:inhibitor of cysteine peptidase
MLSVFLALISVVSACSSGASGRTLTAEDAGQTIEMNIGDTLSVELEGNPSTGYTWEVAEMNASVLKQIGETEFETDSELVGSGGVLILRFEAIGSGQTPLKLVYHRPWEQDAPPEETFEVSIIVR